MAKPPHNYKVGQVRGRATQTIAAREHDAKVWDWILTLAIMRRPRTLADYAARLNEVGVPTRRGGLWSPGLVQRVMKAHGVSAKSLLDRVTRPSPFEPKVDWPFSVYQAYQQTLEAIDSPSPIAGEWVVVTQHEPKPCDLVRYRDEEGQMVRRISIGRYLCSFITAEGSAEIECAAVDLEVFRFFRSRQERKEASLRARIRLFR